MVCIASKCQPEIPEQDLARLVSYKLDVGRVLKRDSLMSKLNQEYQCLFHFDVVVLLVPAEGDVFTAWDSREVQPVTYPNGSQEEQYTIACNYLSKNLLRTRTSLKDRYDEILTEHLTEAQARVLHAEIKCVLIVNGKSGTGKIVIAVHLAKEAMKEGIEETNVVYICSNKGLEYLVNSQLSCLVILAKRTNSLSPNQKSMLERASLIIVDDLHAIELDTHWESNPDDLYLMLFTCAARANTRVAVFFDPDQDYNENLPMDFGHTLYCLAKNHCGGKHITTCTLTERIRNSQQIIRFMQANQSQSKIKGTIECLNDSSGDDIVYEYIGSNVKDSVRRMNERLVKQEGKFGTRSIAILCDDHEQVNDIKTLLIDECNRSFQAENEYPIQGTVICRTEDFGGLDADVIFFILPRNFGRKYVNVFWKYINAISSRARERLEFLLLWNPANEEEQQQQGLRYLNQLLKTDYYVSSNINIYIRDHANCLGGLHYKL